MEAKLLVEDESFETLLALEEEVIDEYVAGGFSELDRQGVERRLNGSREIVDKVEFARALAALGEDHPRSRPPSTVQTHTRQRTSVGVTRLAIAASLLMTLVGVWYWKLPGPAHRVSLQQEQEAFPIDLVAVAVRSVQSRPRVRVPQDVEWVLLRLEVRQSHDSVSAVVVTEDGRKTVHQGDYVPGAGENARVVEVLVPAAALRPGGYLIALSGNRAGQADEIISYYELEIGDD